MSGRDTVGAFISGGHEVTVTYYRRFQDGVEQPPQIESVTTGGRLLVVIDPEDSGQVERLEQAVRGANGWNMLHHERRTNALRAALREFADPTPIEVYEHHVSTNPRDGKPIVARCGKVWRPNQPNTTSVGKCPECAEIVSAGWVS